MGVLNEIEKTSSEFNHFFEIEINKILKNQENYYKSKETRDEEITKAVLDYSSGGKRIRPFIIKTFSDKEFTDTNLTNACLAVEIFHLAALIHDDIIDGADMRRNYPTLHNLINNWVINKKTLGTDAAILLGDVFLTESIYYASFLKNQTKEIFFDMIRRTIRGQYVDILAGNQNYGEVDMEIVQAKNELKTAWYTFVSPMLLGISISINKYTDDDIKKLVESALELGILYQIRDDIIDCLDEKSGKKLFGDIFENQTTWVTLYLKNNNPKAFEKIKEFANKEKTQENTILLKEVFKNIDLKISYEENKNQILNKINSLPSNLEKPKEYFLKILELLSL
jgi:geranylgeranyl pyrophosphate synthase